MLNFRVAVRPLLKHPGFTVVAVLTIAVGIGANAALFSVYDQLVLNPVDVPNPSTLVALTTLNPSNVSVPNVSVPRYREIKANAKSFASVGISAFDNFTLTGHGEPQALNGQRIDATFLPTLGVMPAIGRNFTEAEDVPNGPRVCILSHEVWATQFGGRETIIGETISLDGQSYEVVGIMPPHVTPPFQQVHVFVPRVFEAGGLTTQQVELGSLYAQAIGRLAPGVSISSARDELQAIAAGYKEHFAANLDANYPPEVQTFVDSLVGAIQPTFLTLLGAVAFVLLIACANIASLFLGRLTARHKEIALRQSLGAGRFQVVMQFLTESVIFTTVAGGLGLLLAVWSLWAMQSTLASQLPPNTTLALNGRAVMFTLLVTAISALVVGLAPAWQASKTNVVEALKEGSRGSTARGGRLRSALIVGEVALSVILLVGSGLLLVSFLRLQRTAPGFDPSGSASAMVSLPATRYSSPDQQEDFYSRVIETLKATPGVTGAAAAVGLPMSGFSPRAPYQVEGRPILPLAQRPFAQLNIVTEDYFSVLRIRSASGRGFTSADRRGAPNVAVVNEAFAKRVFPGESAVGKVLLRGPKLEIRAEIVGVIRDVKALGLNVPAPDEIYMSLRQIPRATAAVVARTTGDPAALQAIIRSAVTGTDPDQPTTMFTTLETAIATSLGAQRIVATMTTIFAGIALALSAVGLYSVLAYAVAQRVPEIGIRMALGAHRGQVIGMIMRSGARLVGLGMAIGIAGAVAVARVIQAQLFNVAPLDPLVYAAVVILFGTVAALACLLPSLRASRIDPVVALQQ